VGETVSIDRRVFWLGLGAIALAFALVVITGSCRDCDAPDPEPLPAVGIDAGPGETQIAVRLQHQEADAAAEMNRIRRDNATQIQNFTATQRADFETVSARGPEATAAWFNEFNRRLRNTP
jgi:hypothetical protein